MSGASKESHSDGINQLRCAGLRGATVSFTLDGQPAIAFDGESIAAAMLAGGHRTMRRTARRNDPRGVFCGIGDCYDCLVQVDGRPNVQACLTPVVDGMRIETQQGSGALEPRS